MQATLLHVYGNGVRVDSVLHVDVMEGMSLVHLAKHIFSKTAPPVKKQDEFSRLGVTPKLAFSITHNGQTYVVRQESCEADILKTEASMASAQYGMPF